MRSPIWYPSSTGPRDEDESAVAALSIISTSNDRQQHSSHLEWCDTARAYENYLVNARVGGLLGESLEPISFGSSLPWRQCRHQQSGAVMARAEGKGDPQRAARGRWTGYGFVSSAAMIYRSHAMYEEIKKKKKEKRGGHA